jgi:release factor glutamine methyltransferase
VVTLGQLQGQGVARLMDCLGLERAEARIEVQMLLQRVLGVSRAWVLAHPEHIPDPSCIAAFEAWLQRRAHGEPMAYLLGEREFFGLDFKVTPATLIPRPDTELLVEMALQHLPTADISPITILDMGTGSGAIALSLAHQLPQAEVTAIDASPDALAVARENARRLDLERVHCLQSDWFSALSGQRFNLIVSNPPYIAEADVHLMQGDLRFEPRTALASGADGLNDIRRIIAAAPAHLHRGGWLLLEHGYDQSDLVRQWLEQAGFGAVFSAPDLSGIERVSGGQLDQM